MGFEDDGQELNMTKKGEAPNPLPTIHASNVYVGDDEPDLVQALTYYDSGLWAEAAEVLEPIANKGNLLAIFKFANSLEELGHFEAAEHYWLVAVAAEDGNSCNNLANHLKRQGRGEEARELYEKASELGCSLAMRNLGIELQDDDPKQAEQWFLKAIDAGVSEAYANLAQLYLEQSRESEFLEFARLGIQQGSCYSASLIVVYYFQRDEYEQAIEAAQVALDMWASTNVEQQTHVYQLWVVSLIRLGRLEEAESTIESCSEEIREYMGELVDLLSEVRAGGTEAEARDSYSRARQSEGDPYSRVRKSRD